MSNRDKYERIALELRLDLLITKHLERLEIAFESDEFTLFAIEEIEDKELRIGIKRQFIDMLRIKLGLVQLPTELTELPEGSKSNE